MKCPFCQEDNTRVLDSRPVDDNTAIRRRRLCDSCGRRFTTYEKVETRPLVVIKKDQTREQYDRACYKRPVSAEQIKRLVDSVENEIFRMSDREIESARIGKVLMDHLRDLDGVAYVRFASVYREFKDVNTFMQELEGLVTPKS